MIVSSPVTSCDCRWRAGVWTVLGEEPDVSVAEAARRAGQRRVATALEQHAHDQVKLRAALRLALPVHGRRVSHDSGSTLG